MAKKLKEDKTIHFYEADLDNLLNYVLLECGEFNQSMYMFKNQNNYYVNYYLKKFLNWHSQTPHKLWIQNRAKEHITIKLGTANLTSVVLTDPSDHQIKTEKMFIKLERAVWEHLQSELSKLNKSSSKSEIIAALIARDLFRINLPSKIQHKQFYLLHTGTQIYLMEQWDNKLHLISTTYYCKNSEARYDNVREIETSTAQLIQSVNVVGSDKFIDVNDAKFLSFNDLYNQVLIYTTKCEQLNLPLVYNSDLFIPITGLVNQKQEEIEFWVDKSLSAADFEK